MFFNGHAVPGKEHIHSLQARTQRRARLFVAMHQGYALRLQCGGIRREFSTIGVRAQIILGNVTEHLDRLSSHIQRVLLLFGQVQQPSSTSANSLRGGSPKPCITGYATRASALRQSSE